MGRAAAVLCLGSPRASVSSGALGGHRPGARLGRNALDAAGEELGAFKAVGEQRGVSGGSSEQVPC